MPTPIFSRKLPGGLSSTFAGTVASTFSASNAATAPLQALCPWLCFVSPTTILNKDGSLLAGFRYRGLDPDNLFQAQLDAATARMQRCYAAFDERITLWWITDKTPAAPYPHHAFRHPVAASLDKAYATTFTDGSHFNIDYFVFITFTFDSGSHAFLDRLQRIQQRTGHGLPRALWETMLASFAMESVFDADTDVLRAHHQTFSEILAKFCSTSPLTLSPLQRGGEFEAVLSGLLNRASPPADFTSPESLPVPPDDVLLDGWLPRNTVHPWPDSVKFQGNTNSPGDIRFTAVLGIKQWRKHTAAGVFEALLAIPQVLTVCQIMRFLGVEGTQAVLKQSVSFYELTKVSFAAQAVAAFSSGQAKANPEKVRLKQQVETTKETMDTREVQGCYHNVSILTHAASLDALNGQIAKIDQVLSQKGFVTVRERLNAGPSFAASLPGQWAMQSRWVFNGIDVTADCTPILTMTDDGPQHRFFSEEVFRQPVPKPFLAANRYGGPVHFSAHVGQVGHMLVIAPNGTGKTTFVNFLLSRSFLYPAFRVVIFDRNRSCDVVTALHDGLRVDIRGTPQWNPFSAMMVKAPGGRAWVRQWLCQRLRDGGLGLGNVIGPEHTERIDHALGLMQHEYDARHTPLSMSMFLTLVPDVLARQLQEWRASGPFGMFDCEADAFSLSDWTSFQMDQIMSNDRLFRAFMDYAFRKIYERLDGTPTVIYLEEASFLLNHPDSEALIAEWLKTFRKLFCQVILTIQSPQSAASKETSAALLDNIMTLLLAPNVKYEAHREAYQTCFGLQPHHVDLIGTLPPKGHYLWIQNDAQPQLNGQLKARVLRLLFNSRTLAYLRSEITVLNVLDRHLASGDPEWKRRFIDEVATLN